MAGGFVEQRFLPMAVDRQRFDQIVLRREIEVDGAMAQPRPPDDVGHAGLVKPVL